LGVVVFSLLRSRILIFVFAFAFVPALPLCAEGGAIGQVQPAPKYILIGFVGGFVRHDNPHHGPVQLAERLERTDSKDAYVRVFENRHRKAAYRTILRLLDQDHDGTLSPREKDRAQIILFGQSWGGAAAVILARDLNHVGIPVLLTVQVDSVAKLWQKDAVIPPNVVEAVNFYQTHGLIHGRRAIRAANPARTEILGNYRFDYRHTPLPCERGLSWYDRVLTPGHAQSECDPRLWGQVEALVREHIEPHANLAVADPRP
jgi:pimeloyl-ACP methyl ester carboxylesterase